MATSIIGVDSNADRRLQAQLGNRLRALGAALSRFSVSLVRQATRHAVLAWAVASFFIFATPHAQAVTVTSASPQGEVAKVRQVVLKFSQPVVPFGNARLPDPFSVTCVGTTVAGAGRWIDDSTWRYDFRESLPPGARCNVDAKADWKPSDGALDGKRAFTFQTGGPAIDRVQPYGGVIEEDQYFILQLTGPATTASVLANAWCEVDGIGERMPTRIVTGAPRDELLKAQKLEKIAARVLITTCQRPLPADTDMRLVWGKGIAAASNPSVVTSAEQRFDFHVRAAFTAEFSCERERANAGCLPLRPINVGFTAPVSRQQLAAVRLQPPNGQAIAPSFDPDDKSTESSQLSFKAPLPESTSFTLTMPAGMQDTIGRPLANAASFPLKVATGATPPIAKFAAAPFGIIESKTDSMLPVTLRRVQPDLRPQAPSGSVRDRLLTSDADMLAWYARVQDHHERTMTARQAGLPQAQWYVNETVTDANGRTRIVRNDREVGTRELSLLRTDTSARRLDLPLLDGGDPRPFEVVGIPLAQPGYHVVEIESARLGEALLDKKEPMYVRTGVLLTNLGVHFKHGRESSLAWVTTLDRAQPVEGAEVSVNDCRGKRLWNGRTDSQGLAKIQSVLADNPSDCPADNAYFVTARKPDSNGVVDTTFVFSSWQKGIETWRFNVPTSSDSQPDSRAHTVFDRTLFRAGEQVSMKHFLRLETLNGLADLSAAGMPTQLKITHQGTGQSYTQPLQWQGQRSAVSQWKIPAGAKLGMYDVTLERVAATSSGSNTNSDRQRSSRSWSSGSFRIEEFRLPLVNARIDGPEAVSVAVTEVPLSMHLEYFAGGAMGQAKVSVSAMLEPREGSFPGFDEFSFAPPRDLKPGTVEQEAPDNGDDSDQQTRSSNSSGKLVADKLPVTTDRAGAATVTLKDLPVVERASELTAEMNFNDPNGEVQTVATRIALWPSAVVLGIKSASWASSRGKFKFQVVALDTTGKPIRNQSVDVSGRLSQVISTRKRMVGGFYAYDNRTDVTDLGRLCSGKTDERGLLLCDADMKSAGQVELVAQASDAAGHIARAATSVWVTRQGEIWFEQDNDDRIDLLPEKKRYEPGETARLQVRMPFRQATALVSVEREGVIQTFVTQLRGDDPTIEVPISKDQSWAPNVYVSALVLRGRIRDVPWYSLFTWGWREPVEWARSFWYEGKEYQAPTAMVDLAKPAFKLGIASLKIGLARHELQVKVTTDKPQYGVRETVRTRIKVTQFDKPLAGTEVAFAAVDEGLLALQGNDSWDLLNAMFQQRSLGVETSTAQSEIIGRRHYGRKAVAAGGGGGRGGTRELFDTLLLWSGSVVLDANGEASIDVPLNDSLTSFRLVAVADEGTARFGTGSASVRVTQDLQALSGLPPMVREGDRFTAMLTVRNSTAREMSVHATLQATPYAAPAMGVSSGASAPAMPVIAQPPQDVTVAAGGAVELAWPIDVPQNAGQMVWEAAVDEKNGKARDRIKVTQQVGPAVPITVQQATLQQLDGNFTMAVAPPPDALPMRPSGSGGTAIDDPIARGGVQVGVQPKLTGALPGIRRYFETYPFLCLEQKTSKAVGLRDATLWDRVAAELPSYLDSDGLAGYFPPRPDAASAGSDRLTAYLIAASHEAGFELPAAARDTMLNGLVQFVEGRIQRTNWQPPNLKVRAIDVRKLSAIEALSRYDKAQPRMLGSIEVAPNLWPTAAVIDWYNILRRMKGVPDQAKRLDEASQILRSRLTYAGTTLRFSTEDSDFWWWLMDSADANAARLVLAVLDDPAWKDELPRMVVGSLARQRGGAWLTTTANLWGSLALDKFSARFESIPASGRTIASIAGSSGQAIDWAAQPQGGVMSLPWPAKAGLDLGVAQQGNGKPWLTVQSLAAVPLKAPVDAGYRLSRTVVAVEQKTPGRWSRGDIARVRVTVEAQSDMTWVVVSDPVPGGASLLGSGLGRDSAIATRGEAQRGAYPVFEERGFSTFRSYFDVLPKGTHVVEYTVRLNNPGVFALPPTRVEAMYSPETFGELPNSSLEVLP